MNFSTINNYPVCKLIAVGGQAKVYKVKKNGIKLAIKVYDNEDQVSDVVFMKQRQIMAQIEHQRILQDYEFIERANLTLQDSTQTQKNIVVMPYFKNGDLMNEVINNGKFDPRLILKITKQLISCLTYLYEKNIFHGDFKPQNILLDDSLHPILIDFGFSKKKCLQNNKNLMKLYYMAPQIKKGMPYTQKSQAFSFGVFLFILLIGCLPFKATNHTDRSYRLLLQGKNKQFWEQFDHSFLVQNQQMIKQIKIVIENLLRRNPQKRWSFQNILQSEWFSYEQINQKQYKELFSKRRKEETTDSEEKNIEQQCSR